MNFLSTTEFRSKRFPEVSVTIRSVTIGRRMDFLAAQRQTNGDFEWRRSARALWNALIKDFDGLTVDGVKPSIDSFFLDGPEELVDEISSHLVRLSTPLGSADGADEAIIEGARAQIAEAESRIAQRKNLEPQSSGPIPEAVTPTAASAAATQTKPAASGSDETATASLAT
jgi:hypothetical protein